MNASDILSELEAMGTAQNRKIYKRHGVGDNQYGVSYASHKALKKKIKTDHAAALKLWASGIHDARILATMIADPEAVDADLIESWADDLENYVLTDAFTNLVAKTAFILEKARQWAASEEEWRGQAGWGLIASLAMQNDDLPNAFFESYLDTIKHEIHNAKNRVRHAMNMALISIGTRNPTLHEQAVDVAEHIGKVEVDHGETSCKTPAAIPYMEKTWARKRD